MTAFGNIKRKIKETKEKIQELQSGPQHHTAITEIKKCESELEELLKNEEIMWFQRSRALWLKAGDRNTPFFHQKASNRQKKNTIQQLKKEDGSWAKGDKEVEKVLRKYYMNLFTSVNSINTHRVLEAVKPKVTEEMNRYLTQPYNASEIKQALKQMHPAKSPGPDGMPPLFFQSFWNLIDKSFVDTCLAILNDGVDPTS